MATDSELSRQALVQSVLSVFTEMTGVPIQIVEPSSIAPFETPMLNARISFSGPRSGDLGLLVEPPLAGLISSRMIGIDQSEALIQDMIDDAVKEMLNVVCGQFLTQMFGHRPVFSLSIPLVLSLGARVCNTLLQTTPISAFSAEGHFLLGSVRIAQP